MSSTKSQVKPILRTHAPCALECVSKNKSAAKSAAVPTRKSSRGMQVDKCTTCILDMMIYANMCFENVVKDPTTESGYRFLHKNGSEFVAALMRNITAAYKENYDTVVAVWDKALWTPDAKEWTQKKRSSSSLAECDKVGVEPIAWDHDAPRQLVEWNKPMAPMCAIKATRTAFRYALYQAMKLALLHWSPPPGCRFILDMQPYDATNPATVDEWLVHEQIYVPKAHRTEVDAMREQLRSIEHEKTWRHAARQMSHELGKSSKIYMLPYCIETNVDNIVYKPFMLRACANAIGEADVSVMRWFKLLHAGNKKVSLQGKREIASIADDSSNAQLYSETQLANARAQVAEHTHTDVYIARPDDPQCCLILTRDSDLPSLALVAWARMIVDYCLAADEPITFELIDRLGASGPFINLGDTFSTTLGTVNNACIFGTSAQADKGERRLQRVHEIVDIHRLFCILVLGLYQPPEMPDSGIVPPPQPEQFTATGKRKRTAKVIRFEPSEFPTLALPALSIVSNPVRWLERALSYYAYCVIAGNDYLAGICGVTHATMYRAFRTMLIDKAATTLVWLRGSQARATQRELVPDFDAYMCFIGYCYITHLNNAGTKRVAGAAADASLSTVAAVVADKFKNSSINRHVPDPEKLALMCQRWVWCMYYGFYGADKPSAMLDSSRYGWVPGSRTTLV